MPEENNDYCDKCGNPLLYPDKPCTKCGYNNNFSKNFQKNNGFLKNFGIILSLLFIIFLMFKIFFNSIFPQVPDCSNDLTKEQVLEIFEKNNNDYKTLDKNSISDIYMKNTRATNYNEKIKKYSCNGEIYIKPQKNGFYTIDSAGVRYRVDRWDYNKSQHYAHQYKCEVNYTSEIADNTKHYVESSYESTYGGTILDPRSYKCGFDYN